MYAGEVVERGTVREIFHDARHPYARKLLECDPGRIAEPTRDLPTIPGELPDLVDVPPRLHLSGALPGAFERCVGAAGAARARRRAICAACHKAEQLAPA